MSEYQESDGYYRDNVYWVCPDCGAEVRLNEMYRDEVVCPECQKSGELVIKWED